ncbi:hypothetical protein MP638_006916 [Amoeboaphelidium occidentale]|nr:hypothetical protein MP638_006916 [Amoeboaphelidium occidentale]
MKIAIFGATGPLGSHLVREALAAGHSVKALSRSGKIDSTKDVEIIKGDALDREAVKETIKGTDAVIVTLGHSSSGMDTPSKAQLLINEAVEKESTVKKLIVITSLGCGESYKDLTLITTLFVWLIISKPIADKNIQESTLSGMKKDWTIVRPVGLGNNSMKPTGKGVVAKERGIGSGFVERADVAEFIIKELIKEGGEYSKKKITVGPS